MKVFKLDQKQQEKIEAFFKEEDTYFPDHVLSNTVAILLLIVATMITIMPCLSYEDGDMTISIYGFMMFALGIYLYSGKYVAFTEPLTRKVVSISDLTKYLPVNKKQFALFRIRKILKPCLIGTGITIVLRVIISLGFYGSIDILDFLLPFVLMIVWPVLIEYTRTIL